jgi:hypothetical protein
MARIAEWTGVNSCESREFCLAWKAVTAARADFERIGTAVLKIAFALRSIDQVGTKENHRMRPSGVIP